MLKVGDSVYLRAPEEFNKVFLGQGAEGTVVAIPDNRHVKVDFNVPDDLPNPVMVRRDLLERGGRVTITCGCGQVHRMSPIELAGSSTCRCGRLIVDNGTLAG